MKISIVTISFNQGRFIRECIESVINQDYEDVEYIVVDAGSTDGSREIINSYSSKIAKVIYETDDGPADGLNKGFSHATGEVFGYINADDIYLSGAISHIADVFSRSPETDILCGNGYQLNIEGHPVRKIFSNKWTLKGYAYGVSNIIQQATFFRRGIYQRSGGYNIANRICWDGELIVDMALSGARIDKTKSILGGFRIYVNSITGSGGQHSETYRENCKRISEKILGRPLTKTDKYLSYLYRINKLIRNPVAAYYSLAWKIRSVIWKNKN